VGSNGTGRAINGSGKHHEDDLRDHGGWDPELDGDYNPADFIIPASDHQGHSERIFCRVQPQHERAMSVIMKSRRFPFRTTGDLIRWAVVRGVKVLNRMEPMPGFLGMADAINETLRQEMYIQEFMQMFGTMTGVIQTHIAAGAEGEARKLIATVLGHVRKIDEVYWRKKCEEEIGSRFGHLLEGQTKKKVKVTQTEGGE
jgi:hypothetical protein